MVTKNYIPDSEFKRLILLVVNGEGKKYIYSPLKEVNLTLELLPGEFVEELEEFSQRNAIIIENGRDKHIRECCPRCLKAHALLFARQNGLGSKIEKMLEETFDCEAGHSGYYMDEDELIKID